MYDHHERNVINLKTPTFIIHPSVQLNRARTTDTSHQSTWRPSPRDVASRMTDHWSGPPNGERFWATAAGRPALDSPAEATGHGPATGRIHSDRTDTDTDQPPDGYIATEQTPTRTSHRADT